MAIYQFSTSNCDPGTLYAKVRQAISSPVCLTVRFDVTIPEIRIEFSDDLTSEQQTTLQNVVDTHLDQKIFKINNSEDSPRDIDFRLFGLFVKEIFVDGLLIRKEYYKNFNAGTQVYTDLAVKDEYNYVKNSGGFVLYRDEVVTWYLTDDTIGETKTFRKYYNIEKSIAEAVTRRKNVINAAKAYCLANIAGLMGDGVTPNYMDFLAKLENTGHIIKYENGVKQPLKDWISAATESYLTQQIKDDLLAMLT